MWDTTTIIEHLDLQTPADRSVLPADPTLRFLAYLLDDFSDEWFYRPAVGSRWSYPANTGPASWQITEEMQTAMRYLLPMPAADMQQMVIATMQASLLKLGVLEGFDFIRCVPGQYNDQSCKRCFIAAREISNRQALPICIANL